MLDYDDYNLTKIETFLSENGFKLNSTEITVYHNPYYYYYKYPIVVVFHRDEKIVIKDVLENHKFTFDSTSSDSLIVNFIKYLQKDLVLS